MNKVKRIFYVVVYDIQDNRKREKVSKILEKYGIRVNYSVFECTFTEKQIQSVQEKIDTYIKRKVDRVIYYRLCLDCYTKIVYQPASIHSSPKIVTLI